MKNLKTILFLSLLLFTFSFAEEEEEPRTIEKDGTIYKINSASLNITPNYEDNTIMETSKDIDNVQIAIPLESKSCVIGCLKSCCDMTGCELKFSMGTSMPIGSDDYDPGTSLSIFMPTEWNFDLLGKTWDVSGEINYSTLSGITGADASIVAGIAHFDPSFDLPVQITFGLGISKSEELEGISGLGMIDATYKLPFEKYDMSIGFRFQKMVDTNLAEKEFDFSYLDTFGFNLVCGKSF